MECPGEVAVTPRPVAEDLAWQLGAKAAIEGQARFGKEVSASAVEFEVPAALVISELQAPEFAGWSKQGSRVKVFRMVSPKNSGLFGLVAGKLLLSLSAPSVIVR